MLQRLKIKRRDIVPKQKFRLVYEKMRTFSTLCHYSNIRHYKDRPHIHTKVRKERQRKFENFNLKTFHNSSTKMCSWNANNNTSTLPSIPSLLDDNFSNNQQSQPYIKNGNSSSAPSSSMLLQPKASSAISNQQQQQIQQQQQQQMVVDDVSDFYYV